MFLLLPFSKPSYISVVMFVRAKKIHFCSFVCLLSLLYASLSFTLLLHTKINTYTIPYLLCRMAQYSETYQIYLLYMNLIGDS